MLCVDNHSQGLGLCRLAETLGADEGRGFDEDSSDSQPLKKDVGAMVRPAKISGVEAHVWYCAEMTCLDGELKDGQKSPRSNPCSLACPHLAIGRASCNGIFHA